jgi:ectoine hydroxylase-related dioxygenase (phytanoyl-CoA dioxygenase family)
MSARVTAEHQRDYERDGFVTVKDLLDPALIRSLADEVERFVDHHFRGRRVGAGTPVLTRDSTGVEGEQLYHLVNLWEVSERVRQFVAHPTLVTAAAALTGSPDLQVWSDQVQYKPPHLGGAQDWHQDAPYWDALEPAIALTAWVPLEDAGVDNGCMWMVPGSHRWGVQMAHLAPARERRNLPEFGDLPPLPPPDGPESWPGAQPRPVRLGSVHFHHCLTWHGSPTNRSHWPRRAFAVHYLPRGVRFSGRHPLALGSDRLDLPVGTLMMQAAHRFPIVLQDGVSLAITAP